VRTDPKRIAIARVSLAAAALGIALVAQTAMTVVVIACGGWTGPTQSRNPGSSNNSFQGVAAASATDIWAVGSYQNSLKSSNPLIEHYDGTHWAVVPSPSVGSGDNALRAVAVAGTNEAWAVGTYSAGGPRALIEHFDGEDWDIVLAPNRLSVLTSISAEPGTPDLWAAGVDLSVQPGATLIERFDGQRWSVIPSPNHGPDLNKLLQIVAISAVNVWAVGAYFDAGVGALQTLVEHYDGFRWSLVPSPDLGSKANILNSATASSATDIWAVGSYFDVAGASVEPLVEHYDGNSWSVFPSPTLGPGRHGLNSVAAVSPTDVWAAGQLQNLNAASNQTLLEHFDGKSWTVALSVSPGTLTNSFRAVTNVPGTAGAWAVGDYSSQSQQTKTLAVSRRFC
jgi:hypothetical protein